MREIKQNNLITLSWSHYYFFDCLAPETSSCVRILHLIILPYRSEICPIVAFLVAKERVWGLSLTNQMLLFLDFQWKMRDAKRQDQPGEVPLKTKSSDGSGAAWSL